jgi:hypothetical protein
MSLIVLRTLPASGGALLTGSGIWWPNVCFWHEADMWDPSIAILQRV